MDQEDKLKTAFSTSSEELIHFLVIPFGLVNAPSTFQRLRECSQGDSVGLDFTEYGQHHYT